MKKLLAGIGGVLLLAGVVLAGALTSLGSAGTPAISSTLMTTTRHDVESSSGTSTAGMHASTSADRLTSAESMPDAGTKTTIAGAPTAKTTRCDGSLTSGDRGPLSPAAFAVSGPE